MDLLKVKQISKSYGGTRALKSVSFSAAAGEVHAICGENGAGKSTLIKSLSGAIQPDGGTITLNGEQVKLVDPQHAFDLGIRTVYQEFSLIPHLTVTENILLGRLPTKSIKSWIDWKYAHQKASEVLKKLGFTEIKPKSLASKLSVSHQQIVEIAKAVVESPRLLILDEPSAVLSQKELKILFALIQQLKKENTTILYISHRLEEVFEIADKITVIKDGESMGTVDPKDITIDDLIKMMVGRPLTSIYPDRSSIHGKELMRVKQLSKTNVFNNVSFSLAKGEILGMFGLVGSGRTEVVRCIFGADKITSGEVFIDNERVFIKCPQDAVNKKIALVTEDRKRDGLSLSGSILDNGGLATMSQLSKCFLLNREKQKEVVGNKINEMSIRSQGLNQKVSELSGGNQQKVVLAKWLLLSELKILILDEPTRGVDIGTKVEIYQLIAELADQGVGIIIISSELPEVLGISDRIIVMREGKTAGEFNTKESSEEQLLAKATGVVQ